MIYNLTVTASPGLRARNSPGGDPFISDFFKYNDKLTAISREYAGSMYWYEISSCLRNGVVVELPFPVTYAGAGSSGEYLRIDSTQTEPNPVPSFPQSFVLTDPSGNSAEYVFVRIIE